MVDSISTVGVILWLVIMAACCIAFRIFFIRLLTSCLSCCDGDAKKWCRKRCCCCCLHGRFTEHSGRGEDFHIEEINIGDSPPPYDPNLPPYHIAVDMPKPAYDLNAMMDYQNLVELPVWKDAYPGEFYVEFLPDGPCDMNTVFQKSGRTRNSLPYAGRECSGKHVYGPSALQRFSYASTSSVERACVHQADATVNASTSPSGSVCAQLIGRERDNLTGCLENCDSNLCCCPSGHVISHVNSTISANEQGSSRDGTSNDTPRSSTDINDTSSFPVLPVALIRPSRVRFNERYTIEDNPQVSSCSLEDRSTPGNRAEVRNVIPTDAGGMDSLVDRRTELMSADGLPSYSLAIRLLESD